MPNHGEVLSRRRNLLAWTPLAVPALLRRSLLVRGSAWGPILVGRRPVLWRWPRRCRRPVAAASAVALAAILRWPLRRGFGRWQPVRRRGLGCGWSVLRRTVTWRPRLYRLDRRRAAVGRTIAWLIDRPIVARRPVVARPVIRRITNRRGRPVVRWPVAPVAPISRPGVIRHGARPIPRIWRTIAASPTAPWTTVVIDPARSPIPSPTTPSPGLAHQERCNADANAEGDQPRVQAAPRIYHRGVVLRYIHHLRVHRLDHVDGLACILLHLDLLLRSAAQGARCVGLRPQPLNRCRHLILIRRDGCPDGGIVVNILRHHPQHLGKADQSNECRVEALLLGSRGQLRRGSGFGSAPANCLHPESPGDW